ncbi:TonB-dependent receptor plug domain-containing protein [Flagellimonas lutaonensis]|uniref:TonB-dependent receptor, putative n=1 Tax=Flagellimonas lutaonensis TaxID=516051 RepID=A0A0D5YP79_9FLAO|nr:TonB-dependent receptor plug domain-containing protein [Allomuricauda lutaonensis]AKA33749.1 TonB-dependent receptor, putative [Allomuricauda lutaonensis]
MNKKCFGPLAAFVACTGLCAQQVQPNPPQVQQLDEVIVSDSRFELKRENSGKTVIKITQEELQRNQGKTVAEIINSKSGMEITGSRGRQGEVLGVFARGGRGRQVLIIIDGVRVTDPSSFSQEYDLRLLSAANIESIEITKGAASTLYGPNAATAVINITTKKASGQKITGNFQSSLGTNQNQRNQAYDALGDFSNSVNINGTLGDVTYLVGFANSHASNMSSLIGTEEEDVTSRTTLDVKVGYRPIKKLDFIIFANNTNLKTDYDESFGLVDAPYRFISEQKRTGVTSSFEYGQGSLHLNGAFASYDSENISAFPSTFVGQNWTVDLYNRYTFGMKLHTIVGLNYIKDEAQLEENRSFRIIDPYANVVYISDSGFNLNTGVRLNIHSEYGSKFVYNVNPSYRIRTSKKAYLKVMASYATSYITPSLTQLFGAFGANADLEAEDNRTVETGVEYALGSTLRANLLYFNRNEKNAVIFDNVAFQYFNAGTEIEAQGAEAELHWRLLRDLSLDINYTFAERKGDNAIRIPKHKINALLGYRWNERTFTSLNYRYTGQRIDTDFATFSDVELEPFSLLDAYFSHDVMANKLKVFLNISNIFNEDYVEVIGFSTRGRNIKVGMNLTL